VIFVDTNVLYSVLVKTKFSESAKNVILMPSNLATSATVLSELVFVSLRKLCKDDMELTTTPNSAELLL
jgi:predicted nucleic acid-binding protein